MSQPPYPGQYPPGQPWSDQALSARTGQANRLKDPDDKSFAVRAWQWVGVVIVGAAEAIGGAFIASWVVGFLHQWWPSIPLLHWTLALWITLALTAYSLFKDIIRDIGKKIGGKHYMQSKPKPH